MNNCILPYTSMVVWANGDCGVCCFYDDKNILNEGSLLKTFYGTRYETTRMFFEMGIDLKGCEYCMKKDGYDSTVKHYGDVIFKDMNKKELVEDKKLRYLHYSLTRTCNLACRICTPNNSTKFESVYKETNGESRPTYPIDPTLFLSELDQIVMDLKHFTFHGGEPMLAPYFSEVLDILGKNPNMTIQLITNGTIGFNDDSILERLSKFKEFQVMFSVDGHPQLSNMIRPGYEYKDGYLLDSMRAVKLAGGKTIVHSTIYNMNIMYIDKLFNFLNNECGEYIDELDTYILVHPDKYHISNLPQAGRSLLDKHSIPSLLKMKTSDNSHDSIKRGIDLFLKKFYSEIDMYEFSNTSWNSFIEDCVRKDKLSNTDLHSFMMGTLRGDFDEM